MNNVYLLFAFAVLIILGLVFMFYYLAKRSKKIPVKEPSIPIDRTEDMITDYTITIKKNGEIVSLPIYITPKNCLYTLRDAKNGYRKRYIVGEDREGILKALGIESKGFGIEVVE